MDIFCEGTESLGVLMNKVGDQIVQYVETRVRSQQLGDRSKAVVSWVIGVTAWVCALSLTALSRILSISFLGLGAWINFALSTAVSVVRLGSGNWAATGVEKCHRPENLLILFDCEGSAECRRVRETLAVLGLDAVVFPIPEKISAAEETDNNSPWRSDLEGILAEGVTSGEGSGDRMAQNLTQQLPVLVDPNICSSVRGGRQQLLVGAQAITQYLWRIYGHNASKPWSYTTLGRLEAAPLGLGALYRAIPLLLRPLPVMGHVAVGAFAGSMEQAEQPQLFGYENCPHTRRVRELLCTLQVPHVQRNVPRGCTEKRAEFTAKYSPCEANKLKLIGAVTLPVVVTDGAPNGLRGCTRILNYLSLRYSAPPHPSARPQLGADQVFRRAREVFNHGTETGTLDLVQQGEMSKTSAATVFLSPPYYAGSA